MGKEQNPKARVEQGRRFLVRGAVVQSVGLALVGIGVPQVGSWVLLGGWILLVFGLHSFGRAAGAIG